MKLAELAVALVALCGGPACADAADRAVRVSFNHDDHRYAQGDAVPMQRAIYILFLKEPCPLPLTDRDEMLRAWVSPGRVGCWYPTLGYHFVFVDNLGVQPNEGFWPTFPQAALLKDGTIKLTEPGYDSATYLDQVLKTISSEMLENLQPQKP